MTPERIEGFARQLAEAGADAPFRGEGLLFWSVPDWIVTAYAQARYARTDVAQALAAAAIGDHDAALCRANPKLLIWTLARAWATRLGELERQVRGQGSIAA